MTLELDQEAGGKARSDSPLYHRSWRDWYVWGLVSVAGVFCLGPSLVGARTLISVDALTLYMPWRASGTDVAGHEVCTTDTVDSVMPGIAYFRSHLFAGQLPNWQNIVGGGSPLGSVPDLGLLNPLSLPYFILPLSLAPAFVVLLTWVVAIGGTFLFLRRFEVSRPAATLAGFIFATSGFMVMWTNWPQTRVAAFIPALFWALERLISRKKLLDLVLLAVIVASMLLGGFPAVTGYALYLAAGYLLVRLWILYRQSIRGGLTVAAMAVGGVVLGTGLAAVQMLPFLKWFEAAPTAYRTGETLQGLPNFSLLTLVSPNANGLCIAGKTPSAGGSPVELVSYVGAVALILAVAGAAYGLFNDRYTVRALRTFFVGAVAVILLWAWGSPASRTARSITAPLPAFADNFIGRTRSVLGFCLAVLAALGFDWLIRARARAGPPPDASAYPPSARSASPTSSRLARAWPSVIWLGFGVLGLLVAVAAYRAAAFWHYSHSLLNTSWIPALLLVAALSFVVLRRIRPDRTRTLAAVVIPVLVVAQGAQFFHTVLPGDNPDNFYPTTPTHSFLASHLGHDRYASSGGMMYAGGTMYPATSLYYGLRTPTGHVFVEPAWENLLEAVDPGVMESPTASEFGPSLNQNTIAHQPILDLMGVKYFVLSSDALTGTVEPVPAASGEVSSASGPVGCTIRGAPLRGVSLRLAQPLVASNASDGVTLYATVRDGTNSIASGRFLESGAPAGSVVSIAVPGEDIRPGGTLTVDFSESGATGPLIVTGTRSTAACAAVLPKADGLKLVFADPGSIVYQRLTALPRVRWSSRAVLINSPAARVSTLAEGIPADEVVLSQPGPLGAGLPGAVTVTTDSPDRISADVNAAGSGYLVIADAMQEPGWHATVDGQPASLVPADHAMVAVYVPAGRHRVDVSYSAPGQVAGFGISLIAIVISVTLVAWDVWWGPRRRRRGRADPPAGSAA